MRKFASLVFVCALFLLTGLARAQETDFSIGDNILWSPQNKTALTGFIPPAEKGGAYPSVLLQYRLPNHFGLNVEGAFRYHKGTYDNYQPYRPFIYDANGVYSSRFTAKATGDFMAGIGAQTVLFYNQTFGCNVPAGGCRSYLNSTHFLVHFGAGVRYYFLHNLFVRPEANWYYIVNNFEFHSNNVFRAGATVGYTWGRPKPDKPNPAEK